jgi:hypothetical protein
MSPTAPLGPCSIYGCNGIREDGHRTCRKISHRAVEVEQDRKRAAFLRGRSRSSQRRRRSIRTVYDSKEWAELRRRKLRLSKTCELKIKCLGAPATDVDHVDPIAWGGAELPLIAELRSACHACHSAHTAETMLERDAGGRWRSKQVPDRDRETYDRAKAVTKGRGKG